MAATTGDHDIRQPRPVDYRGRMQPRPSLLLALAASSRDSNMPTISLQVQHPELSPAQQLRQLANDCEQLGVTDWDRYGNFDGSYGSNDDSSSWLRRFEAELATEFGKEDAVFMPSGVMAQSIALLIHQQTQQQGRRRQELQQQPKRGRFACHSTSHLLLHEQQGYKELLGMETIVIESDLCDNDSVFYKPMSYANVQTTLNRDFVDDDSQQHDVSTLILEVPHRELGGKCTSWRDICQMSDYCRNHDIAFHCDGARMFEATAAYDDDLSLAQLAAPFDSVYISFYKGLGGVSGAMLLGNADFCSQAQIWLRRFGGNLYTLLPYAVSGWAGFRRNWCLQQRADEDESVVILSFAEKKRKLSAIVAALQENEAVNKIVTFDPAVPETNMIHGYLTHSVEACNKALRLVHEQNGIEVLKQVRRVARKHPAFHAGFRSYFEWAIGEQNGGIAMETFLCGWTALAEQLQK